MAKILVDISKDIDRLTEEYKKFVIEMEDKLKSIGLIELYNAILEYVE